MVDFVCTEYSDGKVVADQELRKRTAEIGIRKVARQTGIDRNTVRLIMGGEPVKPNTLAEVIEFVQGIDPSK
jgi:hypothetical protein